MQDDHDKHNSSKLKNYRVKAVEDEKHQNKISSTSSKKHREGSSKYDHHSSSSGKHSTLSNAKNSKSQAAEEQIPKSSAAVASSSSAIKSKAEEAKDKRYNYYYEDDFEDYTDDFEEDSGEDEETINSKKEDFQVRRDDHNSEEMLPKNASDTPLMRRLTQSRDVKTKSTVIRRPSQIFGLLNTPFDKAANSRYNALKNLIEMEVVQFEFADIPPVSDYEFYLEMFGDTNKIQVQTQTYDENCNRFVQTEEEETESKWTQHPPTDERGWGIGSTKQNEFTSLDLMDTDVEFYRKRNVDKEKLKKFLDVAGEVMIKLTQPSSHRLAITNLKLSLQAPFSLGYNRFSVENLASKSKVSNVVYHQGTLFVSFFVKEGKAKEIPERTMVVQYVIDNPSIPQRLMTCESEVACGCYVASKYGAFFVGLKDGSCVAFDLSEPLRVFNTEVNWPGVDEPFKLCTPAYDTAFQSISSGEGDDMRSPVVGINATANAAEKNISYQVASINEMGTIFVWTISEADKVSAVVDLGLRPGARLRMALTSIIRLSAAGSSKLTGTSTLNVRCVEYDQNDPFHFYIGTDNKVIFNFTRAKGWSYTGPKAYRTQGLPVEILCERFSPFDAKIFLVGLSNGQLLFFKIDRAHPLLKIENPDNKQVPVTQLEFSPSVCTVFYAVYAGKMLYQWDLNSGKSPTLRYDIGQQNSSTCTCTAMWSQKNSETESQGFLAFGLRNGELQVHAIKPGANKKTSKDLSRIITDLNEKTL
ncbi:unnamed protein product [Enterobius vermicularis]|uniref:Uncharacterized protein n=1 Tax=Enterobius vermicularis TaxID=51028 RepID=A0A3P6IBA0_ENTVE|nr:unnamed protein product [Enterobius vermicularis]